jgi:hypothetical protein
MKKKRKEKERKFFFAKEKGKKVELCQIGRRIL